MIVSRLDPRRERALVVASIVTCLAGSGLFVAVAIGVEYGVFETFDRRLLLACRRADDPTLPIGPAWMVEAARDLTALGGVAVLSIATLGVTGFLWLDGRRRTAGLVAGAVLSGLVVSYVLKQLYDRPRPDLVPHLSYVVTTSFPSGHALMSAVVYLTLGALVAEAVPRKRLRAWVFAVAVLLTLLVGLTRVYMGVHYPSDVLAGWFIGAAWSALWWLLGHTLILRELSMNA